MRISQVVAVAQVPFRTNDPADVVHVTLDVIADGSAKLMFATQCCAVIHVLETVAKLPVIAAQTTDV